MPPDPEFDPLLLDRVLAGEASAAEQATAAAWATVDPAIARLLNSAAVWRTGEHPNTREQSAERDARRAAAAWAELQPRLDAVRPAPEAPARRTSSTVGSGRVARMALALAAALLLVVGAGGAWRSWANTPITHVGAAGTGTTLRLPDGSTVVLSPASRLQHSRRFADSARTVTLHGEAFFDVVHDASQPFRVRARDAVAEDVGTRFIVRAWPELTRVYVAVTEGIVALTDSAAAARGESGTQLRAGETGRLAADGTVIVGTVSPSDDGWVRGELAFENRPIGEVLPALSRWYAQPLRADSALLAQHVTAQLGGLSLREALEAIALGVNAQVTTRGDTLVLLPRRP